MEKLYLIRLYERNVYIEKHTSKQVCIKVDNIGMFVSYENENQLVPENIRRYIMERSHTKCIIPATSLQEAVRKFYAEWWGANIGGVEMETRALWIDAEETILELPSCAFLHTNLRNQFICGEPTGSNNGEHGMCVLEDYDAPSFCPLSPSFFDITNEYDEILRKKVTIDGIEYAYIKAGMLYRTIKNLRTHQKNCKGCDKCIPIAKAG